MLQLALFGGFTLTDSGGREIRIDLAKHRALLVYLAINPDRMIDRGVLAALLWGSQPEARARHSLTQALSSLVRSLGDDADALERGRTQICLRGGRIDADLFRLREQPETMTPARQISAVELFEPGLMTEFNFDEPGFDEWVLMTREEAEQQVLCIGTTYLARDGDSREPDHCIKVARKLLKIDPCFEPAHQALIRTSLQAGDAVGASKQAQTCRNALNDELGVDPCPETKRLIAEIRVAQVESDDDATPAKETGALPDLPSVVVLALQNLTGDPSLYHVCQGLSDDITTELARFRSLFVISQESAFQMSAEQADIRQLCRRLNVRHALVGSLRNHRGKYRINLRLIDGASGQAVWTEKYDIDQTEILELSDDVVENLAARLSNTLEEDAIARVRRTPLADWTAYDHLLQGLVYHHRSWYGTGMLLGAVKHFKRAVELDPQLARAHAYLACAISAPWYKDRELSSLDRCLDHATRAIQIDPMEAEAQRIMGGIYLVRGDHDLADHHFSQARQVNPSNAHVLAHAAKHHTYIGDHRDAVSLVNKARQLNPLHPAWYWQHLGVAMFGQGDYQQAVRMISRLPFLVFYDRLYLAAAYAHLDQHKTAEYHLKIALQQKPELNRGSISKYLPYSRECDLKLVMDGLKIAGLNYQHHIESR